MEMPDFSEIMKQAKVMQDKMQQIQESLLNLQVIGEAGLDNTGKVRVIMTGRHEVKKVVIDTLLMTTANQALLQDLVAAAVNDAVRKIETETQGHMANFAAGLDLPPELKLPLDGQGGMGGI